MFDEVKQVDGSHADDDAEHDGSSIDGEQGAAQLDRGLGRIRLARRLRRLASAGFAVVAALGALLMLSGVNVTPSGPRPPVLVHYMPWFAGPSTLGAGHWGWHWTMDTQDPDVIRADGQREIASHFFPLIGPYDSDDLNVIRYHLLLMKYAGVDGVLVDWYGVSGSNSDVAMLHRNTAALIAQARVVGLRVAVIYEDRFARGVGDVRASLDYARSHWFGLPQYLRLSSTGRPYLGVFGPIGVTDPKAWMSMVRDLGPIDLRTLWNDDDAGYAADGQFAWPYASANGPSWDVRLRGYYSLSRITGRRVTGVAYPGFDDFYAEGERNGRTLFHIPYDDGATLRTTLDLAAGQVGTVDSIQIATWNDFGEGTMVEPTVERGFASLDALQRFDGAGWTELDLRTVLAWYRLATDGNGASGAAFEDLLTGRPAAARAVLGEHGQAVS